MLLGNHFFQSSPAFAGKSGSVFDCGVCPPSPSPPGSSEVEEDMTQHFPLVHKSIIVSVCAQADRRPRIPDDRLFVHKLCEKNAANHKISGQVQAWKCPIITNRTRRQ